jgi:hypothetical protein
MQVAIDSTSLGAFKRCPRYYEHSIIRGLTTREQSVHLVFGSFFHEAAEHYHRLRAAHAEHEDALAEVLLTLLKRTWDTRLNRPWSSGHAEKNRMSLLRAVCWYLEQFFGEGKTDPLKTVLLANGQPAVELSFRFLSGLKCESSGEDFFICGHMDRVVEYGGELLIADIKTTTRGLGPWFFNSFTPGNQFTLYCVAGSVITQGRINGLVVDGVQISATGADFQRQQVPRPQEILDQWVYDLQRWLSYMEQCALEGYWPQNDTACSHYGGCPYREICALAPSQQENFIRGNFTRRTWDPLVVRGK